MFLDGQSKYDLLPLAYLADIFDLINTLNRKLQGRMTNILNNYDALQGFIAKLQLWKVRVQAGSTASFPNLDERLNINERNMPINLQNSIVCHLSHLQKELARYFPDIEENQSEWRFIRQPFDADVDDVAFACQEEFHCLPPFPFAEGVG